MPYNVKLIESWILNYLEIKVYVLLIELNFGLAHSKLTSLKISMWNHNGDAWKRPFISPQCSILLTILFLFSRPIDLTKLAKTQKRIILLAVVTIHISTVKCALILGFLWIRIKLHAPKLPPLHWASFEHLCQNILWFRSSDCRECVAISISWKFALNNDSVVVILSIKVLRDVLRFYCSGDKGELSYFTPWSSVF